MYEKDKLQSVKKIILKLFFEKYSNKLSNPNVGVRLLKKESQYKSFILDKISTEILI